MIHVVHEVGVDHPHVGEHPVDRLGLNRQKGVRVRPDREHVAIGGEPVPHGPPPVDLALAQLAEEVAAAIPQCLPGSGGNPAQLLRIVPNDLQSERAVLGEGTECPS